MVKIIEKINAQKANGERFYSFEFFPPKTQDGIENLYLRMDRMSNLNPSFVDVTWTKRSSDKVLDICSNAQKFSGLDVMMHLTCTDMTREEIKSALDTAKEAGVRNILALRGDPPKGTEKWVPVSKERGEGFLHAVELVEFIRAEYGDYFGVAVAGYPEGHLESSNYEDDIKHLKEKVDAGADFIISQFFYDAGVFIKFAKDCRAAGIACPIVPGIMPIQSYSSFKRMTTYCKTRVPDEVIALLEPLKDDDAAVRTTGANFMVDMCTLLLSSGAADGLHFYTLNLERSVRRILSGLGLGKKLPDVRLEGEHDNEQAATLSADANASKQVGDTTAAERKMPWKASALDNRRKREGVRPIFWANRPKSYLSRTMGWDEFPNGRWGDARSPAFGDLSDSHFYTAAQDSMEDRKAMWGDNPIEMQDIYNVFAAYVEGRIPKLPWCDSALHLETLTIRDRLSRMNKTGFLTINSQPRVNGVSSDDPNFGWGGQGGFVYQKAYVEFFVSPKLLSKLIEVVEQHQNKYSSLSYNAVDSHGNSYSNMKAKGACAVTWGVFPGREVLQPTVVDTESFMVWKEEAFGLWKTSWASCYSPDSESSELIYSAHDSFFLVNVVDHNFVNGNIFEVFDEIMNSEDASVVSGNPHSQ